MDEERRGEEKRERGKNQEGGVGQDRDPIINRKQRRRSVLFGEKLPPPLKKGGVLLVTSVLSQTPFSASTGGRNTAAKPVGTAKDDRAGQVPHIPDTKPVPGQ